MSRLRGPLVRLRLRAPGPHLLVVVWLLVVLLSAPRAAAAPGGTAADPVGVWPLEPQPTVVRDFDPPSSAWGAGHRGVDLLGSTGQDVRAALPGTVSFSGMLAGRGVVVVDHGATRTTYEPLSPAVAVGDPVLAGQPLGTLAPVPSHCAPRVCLHWGWIADPDTYLDPLRLVGLGPVRLLPLWRDAPVSGPHALWGRPWSGRITLPGRAHVGPGHTLLTPRPPLVQPGPVPPPPPAARWAPWWRDRW